MKSKFSRLDSARNLVRAHIRRTRVSELTSLRTLAGYATPAFETHDEYSGEGVGDDDKSWAFDGVRKRKWNGTTMS